MKSLKAANDNQQAGYLWSATPTPFEPNMGIDFDSVDRLVDHHVRLGMDGIMFGGSCGEGPWMPIEDLEALVRHAADHSAGRLGVAAQVTDNSAVRMLRHIDRMAAAGADFAVVAAPYFMMNPTPERILTTYRETIGKSALPVIYYDRGTNDRYRITHEQLPDLLALENLVMIKDSSCEAQRAAMGAAARGKRPQLVCLTGDEFTVAEAVHDGMDGGFLGGAIFNAPLARKIINQVFTGQVETARLVQQQMNELMYRVYGGAEIRVWLTGLKYFLQRLGLFSTTVSYLEYPLDAAARQAIDALFVDPLRSRFVTPLLAPNEEDGC